MAMKLWDNTSHLYLQCCNVYFFHLFLSIFGYLLFVIAITADSKKSFSTLFSKFKMFLLPQHLIQKKATFEIVTFSKQFRKFAEAVRPQIYSMIQISVTKFQFWSSSILERVQ